MESDSKLGPYQPSALRAEEDMRVNELTAQDA
jgi:hypothetical protein